MWAQQHSQTQTHNKQEWREFVSDACATNTQWRPGKLLSGVEFYWVTQQWPGFRCYFRMPNFGNATCNTNHFAEYHLKPHFFLSSVLVTIPLTTSQHPDLMPSHRCRQPGEVIVQCSLTFVLWLRLWNISVTWKEAVVVMDDYRCTLHSLLDRNLSDVHINNDLFSTYSWKIKKNGFGSNWVRDISKLFPELLCIFLFISNRGNCHAQ